MTNKALHGDIQSQKLLFNIHQKGQRKDGEQPVQRITDEQYERIQKVIELVRIGFMRQFREYMDFMTERSEYATVEWEFKRGDMLTEALKKTHFPSEIESLSESFEHFKNVYETAQVLPSAEQCEKYIDELGISE